MNPNFVGPQQNMPQPPIINQPTLPIVPQRKSHFLLWLVIVILVIILGGIGYYFFFQKPANNTTVAGDTTSISKTGDIPPIDDSDLRVPVDVAVVDCGVVNSLAATTSSEVTKYVNSTSTAKASLAVQSLIKKYSVQINTYVKGGDWTKTASVADVNDKMCGLTNIRNVATLALANAKFLAENKKSASAEAIITGVLNTTQQIQNNTGSIIGYLVTISVKDSAINLLLSLKSRGLINATIYKAMLIQYFDNKVGQKKALQSEYSRLAQSIDDIVAGNYNSPLLVGDGSNSELISMIQKEKTSYNYEPNNSKLLYYNLYKSQYVNVDLPCGSTYNTPIPAFDLNDPTTENYIGKTIFSTNAATFDSLNNKRCALETKFGQNAQTVPIENKNATASNVVSIKSKPVPPVAQATVSVMTNIQGVVDSYSACKKDDVICQCKYLTSFHCDSLKSGSTYFSYIQLLSGGKLVRETRSIPNYQQAPINNGLATELEAYLVKLPTSVSLNGDTYQCLDASFIKEGGQWKIGNPDPSPCY